MEEMKDGDNDERNVTDEIGSSGGAAEGQEVFYSDQLSAYGGD